ncbi:hypothetical protein NNJEOMEG_02770 [Fundidesulfovibrio magnetotacticus]|uniref:PilZ domain-containing protein n=1 Tax=Fundidesulfovibrio magnetotacticus TaxID=2730080 RepID=A0A6V8LQZ5_9BACT|nr:hypothetical protein [Fundidesulfovibrio magnetotacticus]GFK94922.1 hypothetical protein NNJEOMEG_02770 [Fundidesulfovibrio magnetotacticus]
MILDLFKKKGPALDETSRQVLEQALVQRAKMDLIFEESVTSIKDLSCAVNTIGADRLYLDLYGLRQPGNFAGRYFSCFFRIREGKGVGYYGFRAKALGVRQATTGGLVLEAQHPVKVERSQRRRSMRVRADLAWFEDLRVWEGGKLAAPVPEEAIMDLEFFRQGKLCRLENLSAGGLGLHVRRIFCTENSFCPTGHEEYTLRLRFLQEVRNQPRELWLSGRTVRLVEDRVSKDLDIGLEFVHVGRADPVSGEILWTPVRDNVADELMTRVFEWHAALFRERGEP